MAGSLIPDVVNAAVDALVADATLTTLLGGTAKVYTYVPETTQPPYVLVQGGREIPWAERFDATGDDGARDVQVTTVAVSRYRGTKEADDITARILTVLLTVATWSGVSGVKSCITPPMRV